MSGQMKTPLAC